MTNWIFFYDSPYRKHHKISLLRGQLRRTSILVRHQAVVLRWLECPPLLQVWRQLLLESHLWGNWIVPIITLHIGLRDYLIQIVTKVSNLFFCPQNKHRCIICYTKSKFHPGRSWFDSSKSRSIAITTGTSITLIIHNEMKHFLTIKLYMMNNS